MPDLLTGTDAQIWIGPIAPDTCDTEAEFVALTPYTAIGLVEIIGEIGDQSNEITGNVISEGRTRRAKGTRNAGTQDVTCFWGPADVGQAALIAAEKTSNRYAIKFSPRDRLTSGGTDSITYYRGLVMSARRQPLQSDNLQRVLYSIGVDSQLTEVAAT